MPASRESQLTVVPVSRYARPKYPTAEEPVDLALRDPRTWPFPSAVAALLVAAGGGACGDGLGSFVPEGVPGPTSADDVAEFGDDIDLSFPERTADGAPLDMPAELSRPAARAEAERIVGLGPVSGDNINPFTMRQSQLPPENVWGKGVPGVLPEEVAVMAIRQVFFERGVSIEGDVAYDHDGVAVELDGLSDDGLVGFEFISTNWALGHGGEPTDDYQDPNVQYDAETGTYVPVVGADEPTTLNDNEIEHLDEDLRNGERYVAVINSIDPRFLHQGRDLGFGDESSSNLDEEEAVESLVRAVHEFIDFLEHEGVI